MLTIYILNNILFNQYSKFVNDEQAIKHLQIYLKYVKTSTVNEDKTKVFLAFAYAMLPNCPTGKLTIGVNLVTSYIQKNVKYNHWNSDLYWLLAKLYKQLKNLPNCKANLENYEALNYKNISNPHSYYSQSNKEKKNSSKYELLKAQVYNLQKRFVQAIVCYQNYMLTNDNDMEVKKQYTDVLLDHNQLEKAHSFYEKYFFKSANILYKFGEKYCERQQDLKAVGFFTKAIKIDSSYQSDTQILSYICLVLESSDKIQEAFDWIQKWKELQPKNPDIIRKLKSLYEKMAESKEISGKPRKLIHKGT